MRFEFVHAADIHLDSPLRGLSSRGDAAKPFVGASRKAFENLVAFVVENEVPLLLIAGDIYDGDWRDYATGQFFVRQMGVLARAGVDVVTITGNHDAESVVSKRLALPSNVVQLSNARPDTVVIDRLGVAVHGRGFETKSVSGNIVASYPPALPGFLNIGMLHTSLTGSDEHGVYAPCSVPDLLAHGYDYWALGHVHHRRRVHDDPPIVFPGNLQGRHARETGSKGATIVTVEDGRISQTRHVEFDAARFETCVVALDGIDERGAADRFVEAAIAAKTAGCGAKPVALRIVLRGETPLHCRLAASPRALLEEMQAVAYRVSDTIFVEAARLSTSDPLSVARSGADVELVAHVEGLTFDPAFREAMAGPLTALLAGLPAKARPVRTLDQILDAALPAARERALSALASGSSS